MWLLYCSQRAFAYVASVFVPGTTFFDHERSVLFFFFLHVMFCGHFRDNGVLARVGKGKCES